MNYYDFYEKQHALELQRRDQLHSNINIPLTVLAIVGGAIGYLMQGFKFSTENTKMFFTICIGLAILAFVIALFFLICFYWPKQKDPYTMADGEHMQIWRGELIKEAGEDPSLENLPNIDPGILNQVDNEIKNGITDMYRLAYTGNQEHNNLKESHLNNAKLALIACVIFTAFSLLPYSILKYDAKETEYRVRLVNDNVDFQKDTVWHKSPLSQKPK